MANSSEDGDASPEAACSSSKENGEDSRSTRKNRSENEPELKELRISLKPVTVRLRRADAYLNAANGKIPLLDRDPVVEGSRNRKTVNAFSVKDAPVAKRGSRAVEIPRGRGKALGRMTTVYTRIKGLDEVLIKALHRGLFGKAVGKQNDLLHNIMQFRGFAFEKDSDEYDEKLTDLSKKFNLQEMKILINAFDLGMNYKSKDEAVKCILNFLVDPQPSKNPKPALEGHPRRKATKRDYFEADLALEYPKKKKKKKKTAAKESEEDSSRQKSSKSKSNAKADEEKTESGKRDDESGNEKDNESKKPAKKRKSNQVIDEEGEEESTKNGETLPAKTKKKKGSKK